VCSSDLWRVTSNNAINWSTQRGWYINMPASTNSDPAERMVNTPLVIDARNGGGYLSDAGKQFWRVIFTTTIVYDDPCARGGTGWIMELDLYTGGRPQVAVLDYNNDDSFDNSDYRGAVDTNSDGTISDAERIASGGVPVTGKKLGDDGVPGDTTLIDFCPPGEECKQYKETAMSTGSPHQTKQNRPPEGIGNPVRIYWQQIL
jgi:Tfp pilus tip-associated adhesin PilY1